LLVNLPIIPNIIFRKSQSIIIEEGRWGFVTLRQIIGTACQLIAHSSQLTGEKIKAKELSHTRHKPATLTAGKDGGQVFD